MKALDINQFPLDGLALIEASAGTGKTYTLANLYLRYLLEKQASVSDILVVTFTEAATQELKDRIRLRIKELITVFQNKGQTECDPNLLRLYQKSEQKELDLIQLRLAERQIDQAEIYTIHGFCQRMLKEYALDSLLPLQHVLVEDLSLHIKQVVEDFWRTSILTLPTDEVAYVYQQWAEPEQLASALKPIMSRHPDKIFPQVPFSGDRTKHDLSDWRRQFEETKKWFRDLKTTTQQHLSEVTKLIAEAPIKSVNNKLNWLGIIERWCLDDTQFEFPVRSGKYNCLQEFTPGKLQEQTKAKQSAPEHPFFNYLEHALENQPPDPGKSLLIYCHQAISAQLEQVKHQGGLLGFDDLIKKLAQGIQVNEKEKTPQAHQLIARIRQRYQVALIDEFQDTDKAQYGIFSTLFGPLAGESAKSLVLIGDPKQAIYAFRGGDIATYLHAKREIQSHAQGELFTMDTNWRSGAQMVESVNTLFQMTENPFMEKDIPFHSVRAGLGAQTNSDAAMHVTQLDIYDGQKKHISKEQISLALAGQCVAQICTLLNAQQATSSELAILVRSSSEAEFIKQRLAEAGVSASFEGKQSIYDTEEAAAILLLIQAVAEPSNDKAIKRCMAEPFFGFADTVLEHLNTDALYLSEYFDLFTGLHELWLGKGIIAMVREAMMSLNVFAHWQKQGLNEVSNQWERRLSNINQLAELLQKQARIHRQPGALVRWFEQQLIQDQMVDDENRMRLESDEQLVRIVTIHKSKGLEYPIVFLPFLYSTRGASEAWFYDQDGRLCLDLLKSEGNINAAEQGRLSEDMRLLYVALTRAKHHCYIGTCAYKNNMKNSLGFKHTAWGFLCTRGGIDDLDDDALARHLGFVAEQSNGSIQFVRKSWSAVAHDACLAQSATTSDAVELAPAKLKRNLYSSWRVTSFTGLLQEHHFGHSSHGIQSALPVWPVEQEGPPGFDILNFPKGSRAGTFLHTLFESVAFSHGTLVPELSQRYADLQDFIRQQLLLSQLVSQEDVEQWATYLGDWLTAVLRLSLGQGFALKDIQDNHYLSEMDFHFAVQDMKAERFNSLLAQYGYVQPVYFSDIQGHFKGAIDLILKADGRFYVIDYKSNFLGYSASDYSEEAMKLAMDEHRYDIQYLIYTLALHRLLKHRLGDSYSYKQHMGGVMYLFLRGLGLSTETEGPALPGVFFTRVPKDLIESLDEGL